MRETDHAIDEGLDPDGPSAEDLDRFGDEFKRCPECKSLVYDQSEMCQACGYAFEREPKGIPPWAVVVVVLVLIAFVLVAVL